MTTDTPKPQEQEESFTRPFVVLAVTAIDRSVLSYRVIDADRNTLADRLSKEQAQWLCDRLNPAPPPAMESERGNGVCAEIIAIMEEYDRQEKSAHGVDTPGGLEHMGDVWRLLDSWRDQIIAARSARTSAGAGDSEIEQLKVRVKELETENYAMRSELHHHHDGF